MTRIPFPVGRANAEQHWAPLSPPDNPAERRGARPSRVSRNPTAHSDSPPGRKRAVIRKAGGFSRPGHTRKQFPSISRQSLISVPVSAPAAKHRSPVARPSLGRCPSGAHPAVRATARRPPPYRLFSAAAARKERSRSTRVIPNSVPGVVVVARRSPARHRQPSSSPARPFLRKPPDSFFGPLEL